MVHTFSEPKDNDVMCSNLLKVLKCSTIIYIVMSMTAKCFKILKFCFKFCCLLKI